MLIAYVLGPLEWMLVAVAGLSAFAGAFLLADALLPGAAEPPIVWRKPVDR